MAIYLVTEEAIITRDRSEDGRVSAHSITLKLHSLLQADNEEQAREQLVEKKYPGFQVQNATLKELPETPETKVLVVDAAYTDTFREETTE